MATPRLRSGLGTAGSLAAGLALASAAPGPASAATSCSSAGAQRRAAAAVRSARARYGLERYGAAVHAALGTVAADGVLTDALRAGNLAAASAEAVRLVRGHRHISAIRIVRAGGLFVDTNVYPFDVAGAQATLRDHRGTVLGTVQVTIQDVLGFVRLVHKYGGSQVVVRGSQGEAKASLPAALAARLPASGCATVGGRVFVVRSFAEAAFTGEPLTIWILTAP